MALLGLLLGYLCSTLGTLVYLGYLSLPWATLGLPLGYPWATLGLPLGYPWATLGLPLGSFGLPWAPLGSLGMHSRQV
jgi:hypothetical protein